MEELEGTGEEAIASVIVVINIIIFGLSARRQGHNQKITSRLFSPITIFIVRALNIAISLLFLTLYGILCINAC